MLITLKFRYLTVMVCGHVIVSGPFVYGTLTISPTLIAQFVRALDLKTQGCGFDSLAGQPNNYLLSFG